MKVVIISDTHGSKSYIQETLSQVLTIKPDLLIHLGDYYSDAEPFIDAGLHVKRVPGTWTSFYRDPSIPNRTLEDINGWTCCLSHTPEPHFNDLAEDVDPITYFENNLCDLFMHGHTHHPNISLDSTYNIGILNPGHLKEHDDRGFPPTFATALVSPHQFDITITELFGGKTLSQGTFIKHEDGRVSLA